MKKKTTNLVTYKIGYSCSESLLDWVKQYNNVLKFTYNRMIEDPKLTTKGITELQKGINHCDLIGSHFKNSAQYDAKSLIKESEDGKRVIFGGKKLFIQRCQDKISVEDFRIKRLRPLCSVGEASHKGNRFFEIISSKEILFKPDREHHYQLKLDPLGRNREKDINLLIKLQNEKALPITYHLDLEYVYITFDYNMIKNYVFPVKENRVFAIDMNPNRVGWSVVDWKGENDYHLVHAGSFEIDLLTKKRNSRKVASDDPFNIYCNNKRNHEVIEISKRLFELAKHYKCEVFAIEKLDMKSSDKGKGRAYNRLVNNNWNRDLMRDQLRKRVNASSITLIEVFPQWNSYIGNLIYRGERLPDACLASIEIGRRGYEYGSQYIFERKPRSKTVMYPNLGGVKSCLIQSLEELGLDKTTFGGCETWIHYLLEVKKSGVKYRFYLEDALKEHQKVFSKVYKRRYVQVYQYV